MRWRTAVVLVLDGTAQRNGGERCRGVVKAAAAGDGAWSRRWWSRDGAGCAVGREKDAAARRDAG